MLLIKSSFLVDLLDIRHNRDPKGTIEKMKEAAAAGLGKTIVERFPYAVNKEASFPEDGQLPEVSLNRDHIYKDRWETSFVALSKEDHKEILNLIEEIKIIKPLYEKLLKLLS